MSPTYVHHVTLDTGHVRRSSRDEIAEDVRPVIAALLTAALDGQEPVIPGEPRGCTLRVLDDQTSRCITAEVLAPYPGLEPLVTIGIATHSRCGAPLWTRLHAQAELLGLAVATDPIRCPPEPWCAALIYPAAATYPDVLEWLGDLERCLAWAWLER